MERLFPSPTYVALTRSLNLKGVAKLDATISLPINFRALKARSGENLDCFYRARESQGRARGNIYALFTQIFCSYHDNMPSFTEIIVNEYINDSEQIKLLAYNSPRSTSFLKKIESHKSTKKTINEFIRMNSGVGRLFFVHK